MVSKKALLVAGATAKKAGRATLRAGARAGRAIRRGVETAGEKAPWALLIGGLAVGAGVAYLFTVKTGGGSTTGCTRDKVEQQEIDCEVGGNAGKQTQKRTTPCVDGSYGSPSSWQNVGSCKTTSENIPQGVMTTAPVFSVEQSTGDPDGDEAIFNVQVSNTGNVAGYFFLRLIECGVAGDSLCEGTHVTINAGGSSTLRVDTKCLSSGAFDVFDLKNCAEIELWEETQGIQDNTGQFGLNCCVPSGSCSQSSTGSAGFCLQEISHCIETTLEDDLTVNLRITNNCSCRSKFRISLLTAVVKREMVFTEIIVSARGTQTITLTTDGIAGATLNDFINDGGCAFIIRAENVDNGEVIEFIRPLDAPNDYGICENNGRYCT